MQKTLSDKRIKNIFDFLISLDINSQKFTEKLNNQNLEMIKIVDEALTHTSANKSFNHEKLEFFGDAVLRLSASEFIDKNFHKMSIGKRSELRAQIVSDEWLTKLGKEIRIANIIIIGSKAMGDKYSKDTIIAECVEALIGALYKSLNSLDIINLWLDEYWKKDSEFILKEPYKFNAKSALQEWCQEREFNLPEYKIRETSKIHGDLRRFYCELFVNGQLKATSYGQSHKKAEKNAAIKVLEELFQTKG